MTQYPYCLPEIKYLSSKRYASSYQRSFARYPGRTIIGHPVTWKIITKFLNTLKSKTDKVYIANFRNHSFPDQLFTNIAIYREDGCSAERNFTLINTHKLNRLLDKLPKKYKIIQRFRHKPLKHEIIIQRTINKK